MKRKKRTNLVYIIAIIILILFFSGVIFFLVKYIQESQVGEVIERKSPYDHIKEQDIKVFKEKVVLDIDNIVWSRFADSHSMEPVLVKGANGLQIIPKSEDQIHVGDIVSYEPTVSERKMLIIHRVIDISTDEQGWYAILKGDNLLERDPGKIRFSQIKKVLIGIIY